MVNSEMHTTLSIGKSRHLNQSLCSSSEEICAYYSFISFFNLHLSLLAYTVNSLALRNATAKEAIMLSSMV